MMYLMGVKVLVRSVDVASVKQSARYTNRILNRAAPSKPPINGPTMGIQLYDQSDDPLPGMGKTKWAIRGPKSRAGFMAKPVGPPRLSPMEVISPPTITGLSPSANLFAPIKRIAS